MANLTNQELNIIKHQLDLEITTIKKFKLYYDICTDPQLKIKLEQITARHQNHFTSLLNLLSTN